MPRAAGARPSPARCRIGHRPRRGRAGLRCALATGQPWRARPRQLRAAGARRARRPRNDGAAGPAPAALSSALVSAALAGASGSRPLLPSACGPRQNCLSRHRVRRGHRAYRRGRVAGRAGGGARRAPRGNADRQKRSRSSRRRMRPADAASRHASGPAPAHARAQAPAGAPRSPSRGCPCCCTRERAR